MWPALQIIATHKCPYNRKWPTGHQNSDVYVYRNYTSIGRISADEEPVLSMTEGHLTLTYRGGDDCGDGRKRETKITFQCDERSLVNLVVCFIYKYIDK